MPMLSLRWKVYKEKEKKKKITSNEQKDMECTMWKNQVADGTEVTTASRGMSPSDFQSDFCMVWLTYLFYSEKKPDHMEINV